MKTDMLVLDDVTVFLTSRFFLYFFKLRNQFFEPHLFFPQKYNSSSLAVITVRGAVKRRYQLCASGEFPLWNRLQIHGEVSKRGDRHRYLCWRTLC